MARNSTLLEQRNHSVRQRYKELEKKYPQWRHGALLQKLAEEFFLSERTVSAIYNYEGTTYGMTA